MSLDPILWAMKDAPVMDAEEWAILVCLAEQADDDGCAAFLSQGTIAKRVRLADRTVRRRLEAMEERGVLARGDQSVAAYLRVDRRPIVWDLMIPLSWFSNLDRLQEYRERKGREPLTGLMRPDLSDAPQKLRRIDYGTTKRPVQESGRTTSPGGQEVRADSQSTAGGLLVQSGGTTSPPTSKYLTHKDDQVRNDAERRSASEQNSADEAGHAEVAPIRRKTLTQHFEEFWRAYPRRKAKGDARNAWDRARKRADIAAILVGAEALAAAGRDPRFIPYPATWLNADGWLDEPDPQIGEGYKPSGEIDVVAVLGPDLWQLPSPPEGIDPGTRAYIDWAREESARHYAERLEQAKDRLERRQA